MELSTFYPTALTALRAGKSWPLISSTGSNNLRPGQRISPAHHAQSGFTLVEVLAVLVIIGLISSAVIFTRPPDKSAVQTHAEALVRDLNAAAQDSLLSGKPSSLAVSENAYQLMTYRNGQWTALSTETDLDLIRPALSKDGSVIKLTRKLVPIVIFDPTGQSSTFSLQLSGESHIYVLSSNGNGRVTMARRS